MGPGRCVSARAFKRKREPSADDVAVVDWYLAQTSVADERYPVSCGSGAPGSSTCYVEQFEQVCQLVRRTAVDKQSGTVVVTGGPGSGKATLVRQAIASVRSARRAIANKPPDDDDDNDDDDDDLVVHYYDGNRDRSEMGVELSHRCRLKQSSCVNVLVIKEFDVYCSLRRQAFLYNLIELIQERQGPASGLAPILVIGMTTRCDCMERLEKRVRSRLRHRLISLPALPFDDYVQLAISMMAPARCSAEWKAKIADLLTEGGTTRNILKTVHELSSGIHALRRLLYYPALKLGQSQIYLHAGDFVDSLRMLNMDPTCALMESLTLIQLMVLTSALSTQLATFTFEQVISEYRKYTGHKKQLNLRRFFIRQAFDMLLSMRLVSWYGEHGSGELPSDAGLCTLNVTVLQIQQTLTRFPDCPYDLLSWAKSCCCSSHLSGSIVDHQYE